MLRDCCSCSLLPCSLPTPALFLAHFPSTPFHIFKCCTPFNQTRFPYLCRSLPVSTRFAIRSFFSSPPRLKFNFPPPRFVTSFPQIFRSPALKISSYHLLFPTSVRSISIFAAILLFLSFVFFSLDYLDGPSGS